MEVAEQNWAGLGRVLLAALCPTEKRKVRGSYSKIVKKSAKTKVRQLLINEEVREITVIIGVIITRRTRLAEQ